MSQELTPEQMRVMIARATGWQHVACTVCNEPGFVAKTPEGDTLWRGEGSRDADDAILRNCPDFCADLNAMAQAEETLTDDQRQQYEIYLARICADDFFEHKTHWSPITTFAKALRRATAFCRVLQTRKGE